MSPRDEPHRTAVEAWIEAIPKVELHVHIEGSIRPSTLLELAGRNHVPLPADTVEGLREWYRFTDFQHFVEVYLTLSRAIRTVDDIERVVRDFLAGQAEQNILHTEATFTSLTHYRNWDLSFDDQIKAIQRARDWAADELGVSLLLVIDIPRDLSTLQEAEMVADWTIDARELGVAALGLAGYERGHPPETFAAPFARARERGQNAIVHAGETGGPDSVRAAIDVLGSRRIGHGVRSVEDPTLIEVLRDRQIPLEVCPTSNVCLGVYPDLASHPLPTLVDEGLYVTLNSDDPPMFGTTLTGEYARAAATFGYEPERLERFVIDAARASLLDEAERLELLERLRAGLDAARSEHF